MKCCSLRQRLEECQIKTTLRFGKPPDPAIRKCRVPFVPIAAELVFHLRSAGEFESVPFVFALQPKLQRRLRICDLSYFAEVRQASIGTSDRRAAVRADQDDGRAFL